MIFAIDPGGATGVAGLAPGTGLSTLTIEGGFDGFSDWLAVWNWPGIDAVVIEKFVPRGGALSIQLDALHIIGAVKHECRVHSVPLVIQTPTQAKSFASNDHLKAVGWYTVGADHERDAARHMLVLITKSNNLPAYTAERIRVLTALAAM